MGKINILDSIHPNLYFRMDLEIHSNPLAGTWYRGWFCSQRNPVYPEGILLMSGLDSLILYCKINFRAYSLNKVFMY